MPRIPPENVRRTGSTEPPENVGPIVELPEPEEEEEPEPSGPGPKTLSFIIPVTRPGDHDATGVMLVGPRIPTDAAGVITDIRYYRRHAAPGSWDTTPIYCRVRTPAGSFNEDFDLAVDGTVHLSSGEWAVSAGGWFSLEFWNHDPREEGNTLPMNDLVSVTVTIAPPA